MSVKTLCYLALVGVEEETNEEGAKYFALLNGGHRLQINQIDYENFADYLGMKNNIETKRTTSHFIDAMEGGDDFDDLKRKFGHE